MTIASTINPWAQAPKQSAKPSRKATIHDDVDSDLQCQGWWIAQARKTTPPAIDLLVAATPPLRRYKH